MKKIVSMIAIIAVLFFSLASCNQTDTPNSAEPSNENTDNGIEPAKNGDSSGQDTNGDTSQPTDSATGDNNTTTDPNTPTSNGAEQTVFHNDVFKDVTITDSEDEITVTGKAQVFEGVFQYALYDGDHAILEDHYQTDGAPAWGDFSITIKKDQIPSTQPKLELFVYSAKDGSKVNTLEIPLSQYKK